MAIRAIGAILRMLIGVAFIAAGIWKLLDAGYLYGGLVHRLEDFGEPYPFYRDSILLRFVEPRQELFAYAVPIAEIVVGALFLLGAFVCLAALVGAVLLGNFALAIGYGSSWIVPAHAAAALLLIVMARATAGCTWGLDALLARRVPAPLLLFPFRWRLPEAYRRISRAPAGNYRGEVHRGRR